MLAEGVAQRGLVRVTGRIRSLGDRTGAGGEEFGRAGKAEAAMISDRGGAAGELEITGEVKLGEAGDRGQLGQADAAVVILVQMRAGALDPVVELASRRRLGR